MNPRKLKLVGCFSGLLLTLCATALYFTVYGRCKAFDCNLTQKPQPAQAVQTLDTTTLYKQAAAITIKVRSKQVLGSGIILQKQGQLYTVLTNAHVLRADNPPYRIQTPDGRIYPAKLPKGVSFGKDDLAILQFVSPDKTYTVASFGNSVKVGDEVFAAGFPFAYEGTKDKGFVFNTGKVSLILPKNLQGGYQVGYTNDIQKGMSGGPLLNRRGEVVGVNGMHAYPLWDAPSVFADGSEADKVLHDLIIRLSWAVPINRVVHLLSDLQPKNSPSPRK